MKITAIIAVVFGFALGLAAAEPGESVVVVYNASMPESKDVAQHYAEVRHVPAGQVLGLNMPTKEVISRADYNECLLKPLVKFLDEKKLFIFEPGAGPADSGPTNKWLMKEFRIRYAVLCYGVPLKIGEDSTIEPDTQMSGTLRRNGAAIDSELSLLPVHGYPLTGPIRNPWYGATNVADMNPRNGLLMVARLDGPTPAIARALVDKAISAETNGLWGRAYFDERGLTNGDLKLGDDWIDVAARCSKRFGFETVVDTNATTLPAAFPLSHVALYAGWYDGQVSGPFARPNVEFMPGAFAYHLHSYSAFTLRTTTNNWVGPLLAEGVTATMGCVEEPLLAGTPDMGTFFTRWLMGRFTFGEAAYASQPALSWQTTVVGDPLYCPFAKAAKAQHEELAARQSPLLEWSHLRVVNLNIALGTPTQELINYLENEAGPVARTSAVLTEKLGDLCQSEGKTGSAIHACREALKLNPSPQQKVRLTFVLADRLIANGQDADALALYEQFLKENPKYPDLIGLYQKLEACARKLNKASKAKHYAVEARHLLKAQNSATK